MNPCFTSILMVLTCGTALADEAVPKRPNIVVILADDMGFSDLGCYGGEIQTPNLDVLASGGLRFTQFYNNARCCPTRASLLTGLYPHQAGIGLMMEDLGEALPGYRGNLSPKCQTIPEQLKPAGYRSYAVGKWHVSRFTGKDGPKDQWPRARGFDRYYGTIHGAGSFYDPSSLVRDETMISPFADPEYQPDTYYYTDAISDHAVRYVSDHARENGNKPFFLYVSYTAAHWPMHALPEDIQKYKDWYNDGYEPIRQARFQKAAQFGLIDSSQGLSAPSGDWSRVHHKDWEAACMEVYAAMVDRMDQGIGKLIAELKRTGEFENTLILYLQDNGACAEAEGRTGNPNHPNIPRPSQPTLMPMSQEDLATPGSVPKQTRDGFPIRMGVNAFPGPADTYVAYGRAWANVSNTPFREYKHFIHEGGISSPLIAHWPAGIPARGELRTAPTHLIDIAATCAELAGSQNSVPGSNQGAMPLEGQSLIPIFSGQTALSRVLCWEHEGNRAVREGDWKLVSKHLGSWELYNVAQDRIEAHNLAAQQPERVAAMTAIYEAWANRVGVKPWPIHRTESADAGGQ